MFKHFQEKVNRNEKMQQDKEQHVPGEGNPDVNQPESRGRRLSTLSWAILCLEMCVGAHIDPFVARAI